MNFINKITSAPQRQFIRAAGCSEGPSPPHNLFMVQLIMVFKVREFKLAFGTIKLKIGVNNK